MEKFPDARRAVLAALWPIEEAEQAGQPGQAAADAGTARPGGGGVAGQPAGVPLPGGKRPELAVPGPADEDRPKGVRGQMAEQGIEYGKGGVQPNRAAGRRGGGGRDEVLPPGSPQGRGRYGDEWPF